MKRFLLSPLAVATLGARMFAPFPVAAQEIGVMIDGQSARFSSAPIMRTGRTYVPLRGIFERLGASVVYENGTINATRGERAISLHIGSTNAQAGGAQITLDAAPFIVGAITYVPLRFVGEALGARVWYDDQRSFVMVNTEHEHAGAQASSQQALPQATPAPPVSNMHLMHLRPENGSVLTTRQPEIAALFDSQVDPNTLRVFLDGLDVSALSTRSTSGVIYVPPSPLQAITHHVRITGKDAQGGFFDTGWSFVSGEEAPNNRVEIFEPKPYENVAGTFLVRGRTLPNAHVHIVGGAIDKIAGLFVFHTGTYVGDTIADDDGRFEQQVRFDTPPGSTIGFSVISMDPRSRESVERRITVRVR